MGDAIGPLIQFEPSQLPVFIPDSEAGRVFGRFLFKNPVKELRLRKFAERVVEILNNIFLCGFSEERKI